MPIRRSRSAAAALASLFFLLPGLAAGQAPGTHHVVHQAAAPGATKPAASGPAESITRHSLEIGGETLRYTAVAGEIHLRGDDGEPAASVFSVSYFRDGVEDPSQRPVTYFFNGGPGSTATWLHLGAFGPRRLDLGEDPLATGAPPYALRSNPYSLLDVTDLVFVDPVGTGFSHALGGGKDADDWGVDEDAASMAEFIRASGYHDLTTTFFGVEHTFDHSGVPRDRLTLENYFGGHMMYLYEPSLAQLSGDIRTFIGEP